MFADLMLAANFILQFIALLNHYNLLHGGARLALQLRSADILSMRRCPDLQQLCADGGTLCRLGRVSQHFNEALIEILLCHRAWLFFVIPRGWGLCRCQLYFISVMKLVNGTKIDIFNLYGLT